MAKRKGRQRALGGLGVGMANAGQYMLQQQNLERQNERVLGRQQIMDAQNYVETLNQAVAKGDLDPDQAKAMAAARGLKLNPASLEAVRPTIRKRLGSALDKLIMEAKTPEDVPSMQDIMSISTTQGAKNLPPSFMVDGALTEDPLAGAAPDVREFAERAETRRRALMAKPTERAEVQDPTSGAKSLQFVSPYAGSIQTTPTAAQEGAIGGAKFVAENEITGPVKAAQAAKETTATTTASEDVRNSPKNVNARVNEALQKKRNELQAELAQSGMTTQQQSAALQLSDDFTNQSKDYFDTAASFRKVASSAQRIQEARKTGADSAASNIGLVFAYMKMLDPASTVREGEQAQARDARGVPDAILNTYNALVNGGRLTDAQVKDFTQSAGTLYQSTKADHTRRIQDFTARATQYRVPPSLVIREPDPALDTLGTTPAGSKLKNKGGQ